MISNLSKVTVMRSAADLAGTGERCPPPPPPERDSVRERESYPTLGGVNLTTLCEIDDLHPQYCSSYPQARANGAPPPRIYEGTSLPRLSYVRLSYV